MSRLDSCCITGQALEGSTQSNIPAMTDMRCLDGQLSCSVIQQVLWVLILISLLLTVRAILSRSWQTMWAVAAVSLAFCLIAIWSIGSLLFLLTCLQLAAALALRHSVALPRRVTSLLAGALAVLVIVYGLASLHAETMWVIAFPLAFIIASIPVFTAFPSHERGTTTSGSGVR